MIKNIIALVGLPASGKTEAVNYLMNKNNWPKVYFGSITFDEMKARGLEVNEQNERIVREDLRLKHGVLYYAEEIIKKIKKIDKAETILVESLYSWDEYLQFKKEFGDTFKVIAVYASPATRYARLVNRPTRPLTPKEAQGRDYAQIVNLAQAGPIAMAEFMVRNEGSIEDLYHQLDEIVF